MNEALAVECGTRYRVLTDADVNETQYYRDTIVLPARKVFRFFPYMVMGDFDGDRVSDLAAMVVNVENGFRRMAVLWGANRRLSYYDGQLADAIDFVPANEVKSHYEKMPLPLPADAIRVRRYESSAWLLYWDGGAFQEYWISDWTIAPAAFPGGAPGGTVHPQPPRRCDRCRLSQPARHLSRVANSLIRSDVRATRCVGEESPNAGVASPATGACNRGASTNRTVSCTCVGAPRGCRVGTSLALRRVTSAVGIPPAPRQESRTMKIKSAIKGGTFLWGD